MYELYYYIFKNNFINLKDYWNYDAGTALLKNKMP